jgi:hypothetical protein
MSVHFDSSPLIYQLILFLAAFGLGGFIFFQRPNTTHFPETTFLVLSALFLAFGRLPVLVFNRELNADESQMLTQAMTLAKDPVYWRSVDGTTGGPLSSYFLILVAFFRGCYDYITAHIGALVLVLFSVIFLFKALANWFGAHRAALGVFPALLFYGFTRYPDFVHYTSEHFPVALLAACIWLTSIWSKNGRISSSKALLLGALLALIPFGKIQAVPLAAALVFYLIYLSAFKGEWMSLGRAIAGGLLTYALLAALLFYHGVADDFLTYYLQGNLQYKNDTPLWKNVLFQLNQSMHATDMLLLIVPLVASLIVYGLSASKRESSASKVGWLGAGMLVLGMYAISRTGSGYTHYLLFLIIPLSLLTTSLLKPLPATKTLKSSFLLALTLLSSVLVVGVQIHQNGVLNRFESGQEVNRRLPFTETGITASQFLTNDDWMVVWGWNCQYYVECATPQGIAENHSIRSIYEHPMRSIYQQRYLQDMKRNRPAVFIDATGKNSLWLQDTVTHSYRSFPELADYIDSNYFLQGSPDGNRLFIRNDLATSN